MVGFNKLTKAFYLTSKLSSILYWFQQHCLMSAFNEFMNQRIYGQKYIKIKLINKNKTQQIILDTFKHFSSQIRRNVLTFIFLKEKNIQIFYKS